MLPKKTLASKFWGILLMVGFRQDAAWYKYGDLRVEDTLRLKNSSNMYGYITLACVLAVAGISHAVPSGYGLGGYGGYGGYGLAAPIITAPIYAPAVSTANLVKAAPIPIIKTVAAPIITAPIIKTVATPVVVSSGWGGYGLGGWGGYGLGGWGGYGLGYGKGLGWGKY